MPLNYITLYIFQNLIWFTFFFKYGIYYKTKQRNFWVSKIYVQNLSQLFFWQVSTLTLEKLGFCERSISSTFVSLWYQLTYQFVLIFFVSFFLCTFIKTAKGHNLGPNKNSPQKYILYGKKTNHLGLCSPSLFCQNICAPLDLMIYDVKSFFFFK